MVTDKVSLKWLELATEAAARAMAAWTRAGTAEELGPVADDFRLAAELIDRARRKPKAAEAKK